MRREGGVGHGTGRLCLCARPAGYCHYQGRPSRRALPPLELAEAGHPVPDARAFAAARRALALTQGLTAEDTVLVLLSGGASALFELPLVPEARLRAITQRLLRSGWISRR